MKLKAIFVSKKIYVKEPSHSKNHYKMLWAKVKKYKHSQKFYFSNGYLMGE